MGRRTLVVDDHPLTRAALVGLLEQHEFPVVAEAGDGEEAIERARELQPDIVLLDLSMPGMCGLEALPRLRAASPGSEVVVLTASDTEENLLAAIRAGAAGYLLKTEPPERIAEFLPASRTARRRSPARSRGACSTASATAGGSTRASRSRSRTS